jgi:hypothetical protein
MSEHQETLKQAVARIEVSFAKIKTYSEKADNFRISAGKQLVELKARIEAGEDGEGVKWWSWYASHFQGRTKRDAQKVMALANADDPEAAAEEERTKNREAVAAHRNRKAEEASYSKARTEYRLTEKEYAESIVREVEHEIAELRDQDLDFDLLRELILQQLTDRFKPEDSAELSAEARKAEYAEEDEPEVSAAQIETARRVIEEDKAKKRRGRKPGSKNKPTVTPEPEPVMESAPDDTPPPEAIAANNEDLNIPDYLQR